MNYLGVVAKKRVVLVGGGTGPYYRSLTVDFTKVPSTQTNFPVLVSLNHSTLKTVANGGHVERSDGFDIGFYSDTGLTSKLKWEMESYDGATGTVVAWVKIASLSSIVDTVFYMGYGNPAITTDLSDPANVWTNGFLGVYHLGNGTTLSVNSSTGTNNGTNHGATATTGKVDGGGAFLRASTQYVDAGTGLNPSSTAITYSMWVKATTFSGSFNSTIVRNDGGSNINGAWVSAAGLFSPFFLTSGGAVGTAGSHTLAVSLWYHLVATYDSAGAGFNSYVNGAVDYTTGPNGTMVTSATSSFIGKDPINAAFEWNGALDEVRMANVARSADWVTTEYNNQNSPSAFMTLGAETGA